MKRLDQNVTTGKQNTVRGSYILVKRQERTSDLEILINTIKKIRPAKPTDIATAEANFLLLLSQLQDDPLLLKSLKQALQNQLKNSNIIPALTESGMVGFTGFIQEVQQKIQNKLLPPLLQPSNVLYTINHVFYHRKDHVWVARIDRALWISLFRLLNIEVNFTQGETLRQLHEALYILTRRMVALSLDKNMMYAYPVDKLANYPFVQLDTEIQQYLVEAEKTENRLDTKVQISKVLGYLHACKEALENITEQRKVKGTSLSQTYVLFRLKQLIERLYLVVDLLDHQNSLNLHRFLDYFTKIICYEKKKNSLRSFMNANLAFLAYQITEHSGKKGVAYITSTRKEYRRLILSSMGGGLIVSFTALLKILLSKVGMAPFYHGIAYSLNYTIGFQAMHATNTTLATKQPAYTASAIAANLNSKLSFEKPNLPMLAITIARTIRSQLASFFGNLVVVFPVSILLAYLYHLATGTYLMGGEKAHQVMVNQHPWQSLSLLYAAFTGVFLFASGIIASYVDNAISYGNLGERLRNHPRLKNNLPTRKLAWVIKYLHNNLGALAGNISLGFFLGMASFLGSILRLPIDIRHITIAAANTGMAWFGGGHNGNIAFLATVIGGVLLIGLVNFAVSFSLAFLVAVKSRGVRLRDFPELFAILARYFRKSPSNFFFPPRTPRQPEDIMKAGA